MGKTKWTDYGESSLTIVSYLLKIEKQNLQFQETHQILEDVFIYLNV